uniref:PAPA-1 domain-containing protein n=1 Tax=Heterorhabditis bacteriophora TaxID=37862 RepID=A0A1I7XPV9_HETBA
MEDSEEAREEVRSESEFRRGRGSGRGRGRGRPSSGGTTPNGQNNEKRKSGRGRNKRGRSVGLGSRVVEALADAVVAATNTGDDVYEFKSSPESESALLSSEYSSREERERSAPPTSKRLRLTEPQPESQGGSNHSGDIEMDEVDDEEENSKHSGIGSRKVPPLRISLTKTPSEEDGQEEPLSHQLTGRKAPRGRPGKRLANADIDEAQRMTRSKVRQTGKVLDEGDSWSKKKRGRTGTNQTAVEEVEDPQVDESLTAARVCEVPCSNTNLFTDVTPAQKLLFLNPQQGIISMKKMMAERWLCGMQEQFRPDRELPSKYLRLSLFTADYPLYSLSDGAGDGGMVN